MKYIITNQLNDNPMKLIFSIACGWIYGLASYGHVFQNLGLHIGPFPHFTQRLNDGIQYAFSVLKAVGIGCGSWFGATCAAYYKKKFDIWNRHKKSKKETL